MDVKTLSEVIANQGFPIALSILLIFRIDRFMHEIVTAQKDGYRQILENTKEIHNTITNLNHFTGCTPLYLHSREFFLHLCKTKRTIFSVLLIKSGDSIVYLFGILQDLPISFFLGNYNLLHKSVYTKD